MPGRRSATEGQEPLPSRSFSSSSADAGFLARLLDDAEDLIVAVDGDFHIVYRNRTFRTALKRRFGVDAGIGTDLVAALAGRPEEQDRVRRLFAAAAGGRAQRARTEVQDPRDPTRVYEVRCQVYADGDSPIGVFRLHDLTARRRLEASEERLRRLADALPNIVWAAAADGTAEFYNSRWEEYTGLDRSPRTINTWHTVVHPADRGATVRAWEAALADGHRYQVEHRLRGATGGYRWHMSIGIPLLDESGRIYRWFGTATEIDDLKRLQERKEEFLAAERAARTEFERLGRMKDDFLATLSHELRTPITAVLGWSQLIRRHSGDPELLEEGLEAVERNARVQTQLISDLLDMNRIVSGKLSLDVQPVALGSVVDDAVESVRLSADAKSIVFDVAADPRAGMVRGDPSRLQQVLWNLLTNAIKFTPEGGRVRVATARAEWNGRPAVELTVEDTGAGIDPEFLPYLFDRFRQADASAARRHGGLGLGLTVVKQLVEMHGGIVQGESDGPGRGSLFRVLLPLQVDRPRSSEGERRSPASVETAEGPSGAERLAGIRVLLVDDDPDTLRMFSRVLQDAGAETWTAASAASAMERLEANRPDVIVSDIGMPGEDGYLLMRRIRALADSDLAAVPAVALTAFARPEDRRRAIVAGFQAHLTKPIDPSTLVQQIRAVASRP